MQRLSTLCLLLAAAAAQSGYEYNKPDKPFAAGTTPNRPGYSPGASGFPASPTSSTFPAAQQNDQYRPSPGSGATPTQSGASGYPSGPTQGYPSNSQRPQGGSPSQAPAFNPQIPANPSAGQTDYSSPGQSYPRPSSGQSGSSYPGQNSNYPGQTSAGQNYQGQVPNYPGQAGQTGPSNQQGAPGQIQGPSGSEFASDNTGAYEGGDYSAIPGQPDIDYPILTEIPQTSFRCDAQAYPGYYADVETRCQVFHICANNRTYDFLCPNGTIFSQQVFVCVWWNQFDCNSAPSLFDLNANLYDYSKTGSKPEGNVNGGPSDYTQGSNPSQYPNSVGSQGSNSFSGSQGPSSYPGSTTSQGASADFSGSGNQLGPGFQGSGQQGATPAYPGSTGSGGAYPSGPGSPAYVNASLHGSSNLPSGPSQGYPSGKPSGPSFQSGGSSGRPQTGDFVQQPNREYLPPRK